MDTGDVEYEYKGTVWVLPAAMVEIQFAWTWADRACRNLATPKAPDAPAELEAMPYGAAGEFAGPGGYEDAQAERLRLTMVKHRDGAAWRSSLEGYSRWIADEALKKYAAEQVDQLAAAAVG